MNVPFRRGDGVAAWKRIADGLEGEIAAGRFRQELFDRLNVVPIAVPSLADRRDDIAALARHFIEQFHEQQGLPLRRLLGAWDGQTGSLVFVVLGVLNLAFASLIRRMYTT